MTWDQTSSNSSEAWQIHDKYADTSPAEGPSYEAGE
jgi:hypothetical protein